MRERKREDERGREKKGEMERRRDLKPVEAICFGGLLHQRAVRIEISH